MRLAVTLTLPAKTKPERRIAENAAAHICGHKYPLTAQDAFEREDTPEAAIFRNAVEHPDPRTAKRNAAVVATSLVAQVCNSAHDYSVRVTKTA